MIFSWTGQFLFFKDWDVKAIKWLCRIIDELVGDNPSTRAALSNMGEEGWVLVSVVQIIYTEPKAEVDETSWLRCFLKKPLRD